MKKKIKIFLNYAREDRQVVENLTEELRNHGFEPWMDSKQLVAGEEWPATVEESMRNADFFLACISEVSVNKRGEIQKEIKRALEKQDEMLRDDIYLIPVRLENCELPGALRHLHWVDVFEKNGLEQLVEAIRKGSRRRESKIIKRKVRQATPSKRSSDAGPRLRKGQAYTDIASSVAFCPLCGKYGNQILIHILESTPGGTRIDEEVGPSDIGIYYVAVCQRCERPLLYWATKGSEPKLGDFHTAERIWPQQGGLHRAVPLEVRDCYVEAVSIGYVSPKAFAGQIRLALELICKDKGLNAGSLEKRLKGLLEQGHITTSLYEMTDTVRQLGNLVIHTAQKLELKHAYAIDDYFRAVVENVYVVPYKLQAHRDMLSVKQIYEEDRPKT